MAGAPYQAGVECNIKGVAGYRRLPFATLYRLPNGSGTGLAAQRPAQE